MAKREKSGDIPSNVTEIILESISDGVFTVDRKWRIMSFNRAAEKITGVPREEAIGRYCWDVFRSDMCEGDCALKRTMNEGQSLVSSSAYIINSARKRIPIMASTALLKDENGVVLGGVETFRDVSLVEELRKKLTDNFQIGDMVSRSPSMRKIFDVLPQVAASDSTVLIQGETGVGKELLAKAVHSLSNRADKPFVAINCGALPDNLLESELFGYKAGAFTNAVKDKPGRFAAAEGGSIFLDEIGDISPAFQVKLLRVLDNNEFQPLGAVLSQKADVRIICATHRDLAEMVAKDEFRQDLFYRINVVRLVLPPLRERKEDIPFLAQHFINRINRLRGRAIEGVSSETMRILMTHDYPGNIRELENIIEHAFALCPNGVIEPRHLPESLLEHAAEPEPNGAALDNAVKETEAQAIMKALEQNNYNRSKAAKALGMHKSTLFRKIKKLNIQLPDRDGRSAS